MKNLEGCTNVVLDGANIIHHDFDIEMKDSDGNRLIQIRPERLKQAIEHCEGLGWPTIAILKRGTYVWGVSNSDSPTVGDMSIIDELISLGKIELVKSDSEDIVFIKYALENNSVLVTRDTFNDKNKNGNLIKRERSLYPEMDWGKIDDRTLDEFQFIKGKFVLPGLTRINVPEQKSSPLITADDLNQLRMEIKGMKMQLRLMNNELLRLGTKDGDVNNISNNRDIYQAVVSNRFGSGEILEFTQFHREVGAAILGLNLTDYPQKWPKDWAAKLRELLGIEAEAKFSIEFLKISQKKLCLELDKQIKGRQNVFLC